jgi:hypothetical protein
MIWIQDITRTRTKNGGWKGNDHIIRVDVIAHTSLGSYEAHDGNIIDKDGSRYELDVFNGTINKGLNDAELKQEMEKRRIDLLNKEPSKGMFESDLQNTNGVKQQKLKNPRNTKTSALDTGIYYILGTWGLIQGKYLKSELRM